MTIIMDLKRIQEDFEWGREGKRGEERRVKGRGETREEVRKGDLLTSLTFQGDGYPRM